MRAALALGADMINDVSGFAGAASIDAVAHGAAALCVMHMRGEPSTMQQAPLYADVVDEVERFLHDRVQALCAAGVERARVVIDPGIGFGKTHEHNLRLLRALPRFAAGGWPVLVGVSRKSTIGRLTGRDVDHRLAGSVAAALAAARAGAAILRVHDVAETRDALAVWEAIGS
jgi:dihydropteroate synthase